MSNNPYQPPTSDVASPLLDDNYHYAGFWIRVVASIIDTIILMLVTGPLLYAIYGPRYFQTEAAIVGVWDFLISWVFPAIAIITFWVYRSATPGKMMLNLKIIDANTGEQPSVGQYIGRYLGYFVAMFPLFIGIIWVAFDARKQGWHDKLASTVVIRQP